MDTLKIIDGVAQLDWIDTFAAPTQDLTDEVYERITNLSPKVEKVSASKFVQFVVRPALVHLPPAAWAIAGIMDLFSGRNPAAASEARLFVAIGLLTVVPSMLAGLGVWANQTIEDIRRLGGLYALTYFGATLLYCTSLGFRSIGNHTLALTAAYFGLITVANAEWLWWVLGQGRQIPEMTPEYALSRRRPLDMTGEVLTV